MPSRSEISYFGAGPAGLPTSVLETASAALLNYQDTGLGLAEHSHRSALAENILKEAKADLANYLDIPDTYEVLFMQGGGTGEFSASIYNFVGFWVARQKALLEAEGKNEEEVLSALKQKVESDLKLDYLVTGSWSLKASQEAARLLGPEFVNIATDSRKGNDGKFGCIAPENEWTLSAKPAMTYFCDNETVDGVEFPAFPACLGKEGEERFVVADMSSNILSRRIPVQNFSALFFGAQKNLGTAGLAVVVIKKSLLPPNLATPTPALMRKLGLPIPPIVLEYATIAKNNSLYNTLAIFDVYVCGQVLKSLLKNSEGKVDGQQALAEKKAGLIYGALEAAPEVYEVVPDKSVASKMNICFRILKGDEKAFLDNAAKLGLLGLKGHRSVGGMRASNYNSVTLKGAEKLAKYLEEFAKQQQ